MRIPQWLHEELAGEAYRRNVSLNQLCFEALVARRELIKKPPVQATIGKLDRKRTQNLKVIERELTKTVTALAKDAPDRKPPREEDRPLLEFVRKAGRPVTFEEVRDGTGKPISAVVSGLMLLHLGKWLRRLPGERFAMATGAEALGIGFG